MATFEESFVYPLILLLIGAGITIGVTSLLIPWFATRSENSKKELEIKVDITSKMDEIIGSIFATLLFLTLRKKKESTSTPLEKDDFFEDLKKLIVDSGIIESKLTSYSTDVNIKEKWRDYVWFLVACKFGSSIFFFKETDAVEKYHLKDFLEEINKYLSDNNLIDSSQKNKINWERFTTNMTFDSDLWDEVNGKIQSQGNKIIKDLLKSRIKIS